MLAELRGEPALHAIVNAVSPDYILLLDGPDVIPHIALDNPLPNDGDSSVDSDLPYASAASFARQPSRYLKITRVVGRVPNLPGANNPARLVALLDFAAKANPRPATDYADYFGLSASVGAQSTSMSLDEAFNGHADRTVAARRCEQSQQSLRPAQPLRQLPRRQPEPRILWPGQPGLSRRAQQRGSWPPTRRVGRSSPPNVATARNSTTALCWPLLTGSPWWISRAGRSPTSAPPTSPTGLPTRMDRRTC